MVALGGWDMDSRSSPVANTNRSDRSTRGKVPSSRSTSSYPPCAYPWAKQTGTNGGSKRYVPQQQAGAPVTIGLWENIVVSGPAAQNATGRAHLDTGNASHTVITRRFAESIGLVDPEGLPFLVPRAAVEYITAGGIVAGATTRQVVVPKVTFAIKGVEVTSKVTITEEGGLGVREHRWDVLVCMNDIKELERSGAKFRPCELD
jgi:hypothetical protein